MSRRERERGLLRVCTGKVRHTRREAIDRARRYAERGEGRGSAYRCVCGYWHIGHNPLDRNTELSRKMLRAKQARRTAGLPSTECRR